MMEDKIYKTVELTNSLLAPGKVFEFGFTKKQYLIYFLDTICWVKLIKTLLIVIGLISALLYQPLYLICGIICLGIDTHGFITKKIGWYFLFLYPVLYFVIHSWLYGFILASFLIGTWNIIVNPYFRKRPFEIDPYKIKSKTKKVEDK